jgi:hypothetical protein
MTKAAFLAALRASIEAAGYDWPAKPNPNDPNETMLDRFIGRTETTINTTCNLVNIDSPSFVTAWRSIGGKGKPTYKALRALPD